MRAAKYNALEDKPIVLFKKDTRTLKFVGVGYIMDYSSDNLLQIFSFELKRMANYMIGYTSYIYFEGEFERLEIDV